MTNVYLEKIALSTKDIREARARGLQAETDTLQRGTSYGAGLGTLAGGIAGHIVSPALERSHSEMLAKVRAAAGFKSTSKGLSVIPKKKFSLGKFSGPVAAMGGLMGAGIGAAAISGKARRDRVSAHTNHINKAIEKSAAVTTSQVERRISRNDSIHGIAANAGALGGMAAGTGAVAAYGAHKGMGHHGGYGAVKDSLKNAYARRKANKEMKLSDGTYFKKLEDIKYPRAVAKYVDKSGIARGVGTSVGSAIFKKGLAGAVTGTIVGGVGASHVISNKLDKSDVKHYLKLHKASLNG